jgi:hypothetical protein
VNDVGSPVLRAAARNVPARGFQIDLTPSHCGNFVAPLCCEYQKFGYHTVWVADRSRSKQNSLQFVICKNPVTGALLARLGETLAWRLIEQVSPDRPVEQGAKHCKGTVSRSGRSAINDGIQEVQGIVLGNVVQ